MHLGDEVRLRQVQLVERAVEEDALRVEHRPHRAVADEHTAGQRFGECRCGHHNQGACTSARTRACPRLNQQIGPRHQVEADRPDALTLLLREAVMVPEEVQPRLHGRQHLVDGVFPASFRPRPSPQIRTRRLVRQEHVDARAAPCRPRLPGGRNAAAGRRARSPSPCPSSDAAGLPPECRTRSARTFRRARPTRMPSISTARPFAR